MSSVVYGTEYKLEGKWVAKNREAADFGGERVNIEVDDATAPKISYETAGETTVNSLLKNSISAICCSEKAVMYRF